MLVGIALDTHTLLKVNDRYHFAVICAFVVTLVGFLIIDSITTHLENSFPINQQGRKEWVPIHTKPTQANFFF